MKPANELIYMHSRQMNDGEEHVNVEDNYDKANAAASVDDDDDCFLF